MHHRAGSTYAAAMHIAIAVTASGLLLAGCSGTDGERPRRPVPTQTGVVLTPSTSTSSTTSTPSPSVNPATAAAVEANDALVESLLSLSAELSRLSDANTLRTANDPMVSALRSTRKALDATRASTTCAGSRANAAAASAAARLVTARSKAIAPVNAKIAAEIVKVDKAVARVTSDRNALKKALAATDTPPTTVAVADVEDALASAATAKKENKADMAAAKVKVTDSVRTANDLASRANTIASRRCS